MNHGTATAKEDSPELKINKGDKFQITAYLPDMERFAILMPTGLLTFQMNEQSFLKAFEVTHD